jgi:hypothetical protein
MQQPFAALLQRVLPAAMALVVLSAMGVASPAAWANGNDAAFWGGVVVGGATNVGGYYAYPNAGYGNAYGYNPGYGYGGGYGQYPAPPYGAPYGHGGGYTYGYPQPAYTPNYGQGYGGAGGVVIGSGAHCQRSGGHHGRRLLD